MYIKQHFPMWGRENFSKIGIFGLKTNHLATLKSAKKRWRHGHSSNTKYVDRQIADFQVAECQIVEKLTHILFITYIT
jgi:hypothetical protein